MLLLSTTLWKLIPHLHTVSPNYIPTTSLLLFFSAYISITVHWHKRSEPFCYHVHGLKVHSGCKCSELNWKDVNTYSVELFFKSISQHYVSLSLKKNTYAHTQTRLPTHILILEATTPERFDKFLFFLSLAPFHIHFLASFPLSFFPRFPPGLSITQRRSNSCHHYV